MLSPIMKKTNTNKNILIESLKMVNIFRKDLKFKQTLDNPPPVCQICNKVYESDIKCYFKEINLCPFDK